MISIYDFGYLETSQSYPVMIDGKLCGSVENSQAEKFV